MSTFDNGWICRECWSANRDVDDRCYRCHVDRPLGAPVTTSPAHEKQAAATLEAVTAPEAQPQPVAATAPPTKKAPPAGRFCLRCGAAWLPGAGFCTQCGTAVSEAAPEPDTATAVAHEEQRGGSSGVRVPQLSLPRLDPAAFVERVRTAILAYYAANERRWEGVMSGLAIAFVLAGLAADRVSGVLRGGLLLVALVITIAFVAEYAGRLLAARDRRDFFMGHLLELAAVTPWLRLLRIGRIAWVVFLRAAFTRVRGWRIRQPLAPPNGRRARLIVLWFVLLVVTGAAALGYSTGDTAGGQARFALVVMLLCVFSGLTAALATAFGGNALGVGDVPERLRVLETLKASSLITASEYELHRAALMQLLSPAEVAGMSARAAGHIATRADRAAPAPGAS